MDVREKGFISTVGLDYRFAPGVVVAKDQAAGEADDFTGGRVQRPPDFVYLARKHRLVISTGIGKRIDEPAQ